jgi:hypothetical protein
LFYHVWNLRPKNYRIEVAPASITIPAGLKAFFEDRYLNQRRELNMVDTAQIEFAVTTDAGSAATDRFRIVFVPDAVLPVRGISLQALCSDGKALLTWKTGAESDMRGYTLQGSADGRRFTTLVFFPTSGSNATYVWTDEQAAASGFNMFRVKGTALDGAVFYSPVVSGVSCNGKPYSIISPNPVQGNVVRLILGGWPAQRMNCIIYNSIGQRILSKQINVNGNRAVLDLNSPQPLVSGAYRLVLEQAEGKRTVLPFTVLE